MGRKRKYPKHKQTKPLWWQKEDEWGNFVFDWTLGLGADTWREIFAVFLLIFAVIVFLGVFGAAGRMGEFLKILNYRFFGTAVGYLFPIAVFWLGVIILFPVKDGVKLSRFVGLFLFFVSMPGLIHLFVPADISREVATNGGGGGIIGFLVSSPLRQSIGTFPAFVVNFAMVLISIMITLISQSRKSLVSNTKAKVLTLMMAESRFIIRMKKKRLSLSSLLLSPGCSAN